MKLVDPVRSVLGQKAGQVWSVNPEASLYQA
jgi:hypothetical protein